MGARRGGVAPAVVEPPEGDVGSYRDMGLDQLLEAFSRASPAPGGGGAAAVAVALSASLCAMTARLSPRMTGASQMATEALAIRDAVAPLCDRDARTYLDVIAAWRGDTSSITDALSAATDVPMDIIEAGTRLAEMAAQLTEAGNPNLRGDALVAAVLAGAGVEAAATLARINLADLPDDERHVVARSRLDDTTRSVRRARRAAGAAGGPGGSG